MDGQQQSREQSLLAILQDPSGASGSAGSSTMPSLGKGGRFSLSSAAAASATASATASSAAAQMMMPPAVTPSVTTTGGLILGPGTQSLSLNVAALPPTIAAGKPLSAQAITLVPSKLEYRLGRSIGTTRDFIAYAVRGGKVRVIEQRTGAMTLLRDHTASLLDLEILSIFKTAHQQSAARLVTVSLDDSVRLWDLQGPSAQADMDEILVDPLLNILGHKSSSDEPMTFTRATFSPRDSNLLAIAGYAQTLFLVNVPLATSASASIQMEPNKAGGATIDLKDRTLLGGVDVLQIPAVCFQFIILQAFKYQRTLQ